MLSIKKIMIHHFYDSSVREALLLQTSLYLQKNHKFTQEDSEKAAAKYINNIKDKFNNYVYNGELHNAERLINKYNNTKHKDYLLISEMITKFRCDVEADKFDKVIALNVKTNKQARGLITLLLDNDIVTKRNKKNSNVYDALYNFDETKPNKSRKKILESFVTKPVHNNISESIEENKNLNGYSNVIESIATSISKSLTNLLTPIEKYLIEKLKKIQQFISNFTMMIYNISEWFVKGVKKDVDTCCDKVLQYRTAKKKKNLKLKPKPKHLRDVRA